MTQFTTPTLEPDNIEPGVMYGRKVEFRAARTLGGDWDNIVPGANLSEEQIEYSVVAIGEDLGSMGILIVDLRNGDQLWRHEDVPTEAAKFWTAAVMFAAQAETLEQQKARGETKTEHA